MTWQNLLNKEFFKRKRNLILFFLLILIFLEFGLLIFAGISTPQNKKKNTILSSANFQDIPTYIEISVSKLRYRLEHFSSNVPPNIFEAAEDEKELRYLVAVFGPEKSMEMLLKEAGGGTIQDCHQQAHTIGRVSYRIYKASALLEVNYDCHSGYLHGAMEEFLNEKGTENIAQEIDEMCRNFDNSFSKFECLHGSGHGILAVNNYDLQAAIVDCKKLNSTYAQNSCYGGVFMENIIAGQGFGEDGHKTKWVSRDPQFPCTEFLTDNEVLYQCYQMQTSWMLTLFNYDFNRVAKECMNVPDQMIHVCFRSYGRDVAGNVLRDQDKIFEKCGFTKDTKYYNDCLEGAVWVILDFWGPNLSNQATDFCKLITNSEYRSKCFSNIALRLKELNLEEVKKEAICSQFDAEYQVMCSTL